MDNASIQQALERGNIYKSLATAFLYPTDRIAGHLRELNNGISVNLEDLEKEYNRMFAHLGSAKCPPYETEYGHDNVFQKTEAMADIAGFYKAYCLEVSDSNSERVDFLSTELEFMAYLSHQEAYAMNNGEDEHLEICLDTQRKFMKDHLGRWTGVFAKILATTTTKKFYEAAGRQLEQFVGSELERLNVLPEEVTAPSKEPTARQEPFGCEACISRTS